MNKSALSDTDNVNALVNFHLNKHYKPQILELCCHLEVRAEQLLNSVELDVRCSSFCLQ